MTYHRAADAKGMTLREFLERHTSAELTEIIVRDRLDPYDLGTRIELAAGKICALLYNAHRDPNKGEPLSAGDFIPKWGERYREQVEQENEVTPMTPEQVRAVMARLRG